MTTVLLLKDTETEDDQVVSSGTLAEETYNAEPDDEVPFYRCAACRQVVTNRASEVSINGFFLHTFANPAGLVFDIACFRRAPGCGVAGPPSNEFSWFSGYTWQIAHCIGCGVHIGWRFNGLEGDVFFGLITDLLILTGTGGS